MNQTVNLRTLGIAISLTATAIPGCVFLFGWLLGIDIITRIFSSLPAMTSNTSLTLFLCGIGALSLYKNLSHNIQISCAAIITLSATVLITHSQIFPSSSARDGMSTATIISITSIVLSIILRSTKNLWAIRLAQQTETVSLMIAIIAITGYIFDSESLLSIIGFERLSILTISTVLLLDLSLLMVNTKFGWIQTLICNSSGSIYFRRLSLSVIPIFFISALLLYEYSTERQEALSFSISILISFVVLLWFMLGLILTRRINLNQNYLKYLASIDPLTEIANRRQYDKELMSAFQKSKNTSVVLVGCDVDDFKHVNDTYGHDVGDLLLRTVAERLISVTRPSDLVARLGGDEFSIILEKGSSLADGEAVAKRLVSVLKLPILHGETNIECSVSIGIVIVETAHTSSSQAVRQLDSAIYEAKRLGSGTVITYSKELHERLESERKLKSEVKKALEVGEFIPFFQPILARETGQICAFEVLARWKHPLRGLLEPASFFSIADELCLATRLSEDVTLQAIKVFSDIPSSLSIPPNINLNVSQKGICSDRLFGVICMARNAGIGITLEILETSLVENWIDTQFEAIRNFKKLGCKVAIDDFGSGHASLTSIVSLDPDEIKIDKKLVQNCSNSDLGRTVVNTAIHLAHQLNKKVVAEGVETPAQEAILKEMGCNFFQGYKYYRPLSISGVLKLYHKDFQNDQTAPSGVLESVGLPTVNNMFFQ